MSTNQQELTPEGVLNSIGYAAFVGGLFSRSNPPDISKDVTHAVLGVATELHELRRATDAVNAIEEAGDLEFYTVALGNLVFEITGLSPLEFVLGDDVDDYYGYVSSEYSEQDLIDDKTTELLDAVKRWVGYGRKPADLLQLLRDAVNLQIFACANQPLLAIEDETTLTKVRLANVAKLIDRYKGLTFSAERAVDRDIDSERAVLETHAA